MMRAARTLRKKMTLLSLKRRFDRLDRHLDRKFKKIDRRFEQIDQRFKQVDRRFEQIDKRFEHVDRQFVELREEIARSAQKLHRHFDVVVESIHDDMRLFAEAIGLQSKQIGQHDVRITRLERRTLT